MWTPTEVRKLLILLTGIGLEIVGVNLLNNEFKNSGTIDINSSLISGKIESGNIGLLICFLGLFVMALSFLGKKEIINNAAVHNSLIQEKNAPISSINKNQKRSLAVALAFGVFTLLLIFGGNFLLIKGWLIGSALMFFGFGAAIIELILIIVFISSYLDSDQE